MLRFAILMAVCVFQAQANVPHQRPEIDGEQNIVDHPRENGDETLITTTPTPDDFLLDKEDQYTEPTTSPVARGTDQDVLDMPSVVPPPAAFIPMETPYQSVRDDYEDCTDAAPASWQRECTADVIGLSRDCPVLSCRHIYDLNPTAKDGIYYAHVLDKREREIIFPVFCLMSEGGFTMVTKIPSFIEASNVTDMWFGDREVNEGYADILQLSHPDSAPLVAYKNRILRHWSMHSGGVDWSVARVALIKNAAIVQYIDFDTTKTGHSDTWPWFNPATVLGSSWRDLTSETPVRQISHDTTSPARAFSVNMDFLGQCGQEISWMTGVAPKGGRFCQWTVPNPSTGSTDGLLWIYSTRPERVTFSQTIGDITDIADSFVILLR